MTYKIDTCRLTLLEYGNDWLAQYQYIMTEWEIGSWCWRLISERDSTIVAMGEHLNTVTCTHHDMTLDVTLRQTKCCEIHRYTRCIY